MLKRMITVTWVLVMLTLTGCASSRFAVEQPATTNFGQFDGLQINQFKSNLAAEEPTEIAAGLAGQLKEKLDERAKSDDKQPMFAKVDTAPVETTNPLIADCTLTSYEKGSRAKRYFIGFGAGKAFSTVRCAFIAANSEETISQASFDGELSIGMFGGSVNEASGAMLNSIIEFIEANY